LEKLIINADDFGLTRGVNRAVIECYQRGALTSATLMVNGEAAVDAALAAADNTGLGVGLHLNLTSGAPMRPPGEVPSLLGADGRFPGLRQALWRLTIGKARTRELEDEIVAQIDRMVELGVRPTHIDSHHHLHAHPRLRSLLSRVCPRHGIHRMRGYHMPVRSTKSLGVVLAARLPAGAPLKSPDRFMGIEEMGGGELAAPLRRELARTGGTLELMCHPGYVDEDLARATSYSAPRQLELERLLSPEVAAAIEESGVLTASFAAI